jgi:hypothetical protein
MLELPEYEFPGESPTSNLLSGGENVILADALTATSARISTQTKVKKTNFFITFF